jgi:hypothetical protein
MNRRRGRKRKSRKGRKKTDLDGNPIFYLKGAKKSWDPSRMRMDGINQVGGLVGAGRGKRAIMTKLRVLSK